MTTKKRIYVAGPMTGIKDYNQQAFRNITDLLRSEGWEVISPVEMGEEIGLTPEALETSPDLLKWLINEELAAVDICDAIMLLRGWTTSKGARLELSRAIAGNLEIIYELDYMQNRSAYTSRRSA